jgi:hypothetical protein
LFIKTQNKNLSIKGVCANASYRGTFVDFVKTKHCENTEISQQIKPQK